MKRLLCLALLGLAVSSASAGTLSDEDQAYYRSLVQDGALFGWLAQVNQVAEGWEYWIDYYTSGGQNDGWGYWMGGFDVSGVQNNAPGETCIRDIWSYECFGRGTDFVMPETIHVEADYGTDGWSAYRNATPTGPPAGTTYTDRLWMFNWGGGTAGMDPGLLMTWRLVLDQPVFDGDLWVATSWTAPLMVFNMPANNLPGDFDGDGDVDSDDINDLCANLTGPGVPPSDPKYDLDGDSDADQDDMDMLIHDLVEITGGDGTGTEYGDFDLDGDVDTTDLTILATNFGVGTTWLEGNANCDLVIDTTDLTILATNFGFVASGAVPEPATLSLLALGAAGLATLRRSRQN